MDRKAADDEYDEYYVGDDGSYEQIERKGRWALTRLIMMNMMVVIVLMMILDNDDDDDDYEWLARKGEGGPTGH